MNQILGSGAVREYQEEQLHSSASYAAKAVSEKDYERNRFLSDTECWPLVSGAIVGEIVELIGDSGDQLLNRMGGAGPWCRACGAVDLIFFAVVYCR